MRGTGIRRPLVAPGVGPLTWLPTADGVLALTRDGGTRCPVNLADTPVGLPGHTEVLLAGGRPDTDGRLPKDTAVRLRVRARWPGDRTALFSEVGVYPS